MPSNVTSRERQLMNPFTKFKLFGVFPYKFVLHIVLVVFVTILASEETSYDNQYTNNSIQA